ncbi:kinase-like domain-containing protein [Rhizoctonia solani]|nr:kinase-like domain-containing protein [Rhizoctonia solani]
MRVGPNPGFWGWNSSDTALGGVIYDYDSVTKSKAWTQWTAPEIATGSKPTFSSDIYSLGMETITGDFPYGPTFCLSSEGRAASSPFLFGLRKFIAVDFSAPFGNSQPKSSHSKVTRDIIPSRPKDKLPENTSGNVVWDVLCKCWLPNSTDRPSAGYICAAMRTVHQTLEETTVQDLVTHYEQRYLRNYTEVLQQTGITTAIPFADTALANVYKIDLPNQESIAVKCVKHTTPYKRLKRAARELSCWSLNVHENILPVLGFAVVKGELAMISPWMSNGCITDYINTHPTADLLELCIQLTQAIAYLHKYDVIHGDIKSANVLISDTHQVKVTDFGVSITDHQEIEFTSTSSNGTQRWQAPEVLRGDTDSTKEGDIYSLSMEIYTGERPYGSMDWNGQTTMKVFKNQLRPSRPLRIIPDKQGDKLWKLLNQCWAGTPSHRPTSAEVYRRLSGSRGGGHAKRLDEEWMALELELDRSSTHGPVANSTPVRSLFRKFL